MPRRTSSIAAGLGLVLIGLLTGCATGAGGAGSPAPIAEAPGVAGGEVGAAWLDAGRLLAVVTEGSSTPSCWPIAGEVSADGQTITVDLVDNPRLGEGCDGDLAPGATLVGVPEGVDVTETVEIVTTGAFEGTGELDGLDAGAAASGEMTDYLPSAGWAGDRDLVVLSWGSSSCAPIADAAELTGADEVTVTFVTPPDNQICTMDMAPRVTVAHVDGDVDDVAFAVLEGTPEFDNIRVEILR